MKQYSEDMLAFQQIVKACETLGWDVSLQVDGEPDDENSTVIGMVLGESEYVERAVDILNEDIENG